MNWIKIIIIFFLFFFHLFSDEAAISKVFPALVRIEVISIEYSQGKEIKVEGIGSGVIISEDGYVVTNHHVAGNASKITCVLTDGRKILAERVGTDPLTDICVLKLKGEKNEKYPYANFGNSDLVKIGDTVFALGNPNAISSSVSKGIISNTSMIMPTRFFGEFTLDEEKVGSIVKWIVHDASIYSGNSGGPLINDKGEIIGINEISIGLGGAIPSNLVKKVVNEIISFGKVNRSWIGVEVQPLLKTQEKNGALVRCVIQDSPAQKAGILPGDIIISVDKQPVKVLFPEDIPIFNSLIYDLPIGKEISIEVKRNNEIKKFNLTTLPLDKAKGNEIEIKELGISGMNLTSLSAKKLGRKNTNGVLVSGVRPGGACEDAKPPIMPGDVIVEIESKPVKNVEELLKIVQEILKDKKEVPTLIKFERKNEKYLTIAKLKVEKQEIEPEKEAKKPWIPIKYQVVTQELAEKIGIKGKKGVRITNVYKTIETEKAGIKEGDIIIAINGEEIHVSSYWDTEVFTQMLKRYKIGEQVELTIIRDGNELKVPITLVESPLSKKEMKKIINKDLGFTVRDLTFEEMKGGEDNIKGCIVESVEPGSIASISNLSVGDVIVSVNGKEIKDLDMFKEVIGKIYDESISPITFFVKRGIESKFIEIEPDWNKIKRR
jgi:serine protease Do